MSETSCPAAPGAADSSSPARTGELFLVSVMGLFLELLLVRWIGTEVRIFAYLQNAVLVACFLGLGMGALTCRQEVSWRQVLGPLLIVTLVLSVPFVRQSLGRINSMVALFAEVEFWMHISVSPLEAIFYGLVGLGAMLVFLLLIWDMFVPVGRLLGRLLDDHPQPIRAYSVYVAFPAS